MHRLGERAARSSETEVTMSTTLQPEWASVGPGRRAPGDDVEFEAHQVSQTAGQCRVSIFNSLCCE